MPVVVDRGYLMTAEGPKLSAQSIMFNFLYGTISTPDINFN